MRLVKSLYIAEEWLKRKGGEKKRAAVGWKQKTQKWHKIEANEAQLESKDTQARNQATWNI